MHRAVLVVVLAAGCGRTGFEPPILDAPEPPYHTLVVADQAQGYWRLGVSPADASGHALGGTVVGDVTLGQPGALAGDGDGAARFGEDSWISVGDVFGFTAGEAFTLELWLDPDDTNSAAAVVAKGDYLALDSGYAVFVTQTGSAGQIAFFSYGATGYGGVSVPLRLGVWTHVAVALEGTAVAIYLDGTLATRQLLPGRWDPSPAPFTIAGPSYAPHGGGSFHGLVDEVAVYDGALTESVIRRHFAAGAHR
jgi:hypothetical protein